jgi:cysteine-rich CWC protein
MLHKLKELINPETRAPRECEACSNPFICGASLRGCWCLEVKLSAEARKKLREHYKRCLCRKCLMKFAETPK